MVFGSKPKEEAAKVEEPKEEDKRQVFTRGFGDKYKEYFNRREEIDSIPWWDRFKRPVRNSTIFRELPGFQGFWTRLAILIFVVRKLPFTNPSARVLSFIMGVDFCRGRVHYTAIMNDDEMNELKNFDLMFRQVTTRTLTRNPDYRMEHEDWYMFNKPAYRTPAGYEYNADVLARFLCVNYNKFKPRPVQWHGEWEQENPLVLDLNAPHHDHWLSIH
jgi:hypothetical protein